MTVSPTASPAWHHGVGVLELAGQQALRRRRFVVESAAPKR